MTKKIIFNSGNISYDINGEGKCVVFLHGFLESKSIWNNFNLKLINNYKVISIDLPGHGESSVYSDCHTMDFMANCVYEVLKNEDIQKCAIISHSMGGYVSLAFYKKFPDLVFGLGLINSTALNDTPEKLENRTRAINAVNTHKELYINNTIDNLFAPSNIELFKDEINTIKEIALKTSKDGIIAAINGMKTRESSIETLKNLKIPILFIIGKQDSLIPSESMLDQICLPPSSMTIMLEKSGHMGYIEDFEITSTIVLNCLEGFFNF